MPTTYRGTIDGFEGSWQSGLGYLVINGMPVMCENAPTVRALEGAFGDVIGEGHTVNTKALAGKEIIYSVDDLGLLMGLTPVDEWEGPEIPAEGIEDDE